LCGDVYSDSRYDDDGCDGDIGNNDNEQVQCEQE